MKVLVSLTNFNQKNFFVLIPGRTRSLVTFRALYWQPSNHTWTAGNISSIENLWLYSQFGYYAI